MRRRIAGGLAALLFLLSAAGCTYTVAGDTPAPIEPPQPSRPPTVEYTVADFSFALGGGDPETSLFDGEMLSTEIMQAWQERGYLRTQEFADEGAFSGAADYQLTVCGSQRGDTSFTMQVINVLTLSLVPYTITQHYDFQFVLEDGRSGTQYAAMVQGSDKTWVQPFLVLTLPWAGRGHRATMQRVGDSLYAEFVRQGAFTGDDRGTACAVRDPTLELICTSIASCEDRTD
jgi:hypothetical protein